MPSDLYTFDISFQRHSSPSPSPSPDMVFYDYDASGGGGGGERGGGDLLFFSHPFLTDSPIHVTQANFNNSLDPFFSCSPLQNQLPYQPIPLHLLSNGQNIKGDESENLSVLDGPQLITEECQICVDYSYNQHFLSQSSCVIESESKLMQRSFSCNSFDGKPFQPHLNSPNFQRHAFNSPENTFFNGEMRRVCSTGDLQNMKATDMSEKESLLLAEANFKVRRYSAEERKEKISKYRAKRSQRKFNKTIKYACRKTLADNRTRIRGRFARNDETAEIRKAPCSSSTAEEYEDEFWVNELWFNFKLNSLEG